MKVYAEERGINKVEGGLIPHPEHRGPGRHIPPHERKGLMHIDFDAGDWALLNRVFGDKDTAYAAAEVIRGAPPEIQILAIQLMDIIEEEV